MKLFYVFLFKLTFPRFSASCGSLKTLNSRWLPYKFTKHGPNVGRKPRLSSTVVETKVGEGVEDEDEE